MASGKISPRQKMINMMYLVLTAMLAMNVSAEILNAFKTVNKSLDKTNQILSQKNRSIYDAFNDALNDPQQKQKAAIWKPKADQVKTLSDKIFNDIEDYKSKIKKNSGLKVENGEETYKFDDLDQAEILFSKNGEGKKLYDKMIQYKKDIINVVKSSPEGADPLIISQLTSLEKSLPIDLNVPKGKTESGHTYNNDHIGWTTSNFHKTPSVAAITILSKLQNDVKNSEAQMADFCISQLGKVKLVYDKFAAVAAANTTYCMPGDAIEVSAGVGAFNDQAKPIININGSNVPLNSEGMAVWKSTAAGASGERQIPVKIQYTTPDGKVESKSMTLKYTIGTPAGSALMLDKMNVFYIGLDNPVTVSSGTGDDRTKLTYSGGGITMNKVAPGKYVVRVTTVGEANVSINADGKQTAFKFRVKRVPDPIATLGGTITTQKVPSGTMKAQQGVMAVLQNFDFEAKFEVVSYEFSYVPKGGDVLSGTVNGAAFNGALNGYKNSCKKGDVFQFENVKVKGPDGQIRKIPGLGVTII